MSSELEKGDIEETKEDQASDVQMQSDYVEEDSEVILTWVVTSDEDSKESNSRQSGASKEGQKSEDNKEENLNQKTDIEKQNLNEKTDIVGEVNTTEGIDDMKPGPIILRNRSKRKASTECVENSSTLTDTILFCKSTESEAQWKNGDDFLGFNDIEESSEKRLKLTEEPQHDNITMEVAENTQQKDESPNETQDESTNNTKPKEDLEMINSPKGSTRNTEVDKPPTPATNKLKHSKESLFRKPFDMGWKREFVYRAIPGISKEKGEVYYINPSGKKLRTRTEVSQHLTPGLALENFTFSKEPLGFEEELIRSAKPTSRSSQSFPVDQNRELLGKRVPKPKAPKGASPPPQGWTATKAVKSAVVQSPRTNTRALEEVDSKVPSKQNNKTGKSVKRNSTADSGLLPSLQTGDDLIVRKRIQNSRNKNLPGSPDSPQLSAPPRPVIDTFAANFFSNVSLGYDILIQIFQYLKVQELLRAGRVCRVWYVVANHRSLWRTVRMKNSQVNDWTGLAAALRRNETKHLDLRKMLISSTNADEMWSSFSRNIQTVVSLQTIDLCKCSSKIVQSLFISNPSLKILNAVTIKDETLSLENLERLENLEELRLKSIDGCVLEGDLTPLRSLKNLRHLSLTSFQSLGLKEIEIIGDMMGLESLELGECSEFGSKFAKNVLPKLQNLERLRLEKGLGDCSTLEILETVSKLENLVQLELVNFDIKTGFDDKLALCTNIKRLLLIPTYISQSATTNNIVLNAVLQLQGSLQSLTWAVTLELLRVTALYVDQCDNKKKDKKFFDESIPVLKPVPGIEGDTEKLQKTSPDVPQVEILPLVKVEKILTAGMPTTKFKILKVPYHATWRQNLVDN